MASRKEEYQYKVQQLEEMLKYEQSVPESEQFGSHLQHWAAGKPINIDAGAIQELINYYKHLAYREELMEDPWYRFRCERDAYLRKQGTCL